MKEPPKKEPPKKTPVKEICHRCGKLFYHFDKGYKYCFECSKAKFNT